MTWTRAVLITAALAFGVVTISAQSNPPTSSLTATCSSPKFKLHLEGDPEGSFPHPRWVESVGTDAE